MAIPAFFNWSGGKDSAFALLLAQADYSFEIKYLFTTLSGSTNRISMHGVKEELLVKQAESIGLELIKSFLPDKVPMEKYDELIGSEMQKLKSAGIEHAFFGDIFLEDLRQYREDRLKKAGMHVHFPLWKRKTNSLIWEFLELGFKTIVTCVSEKHLDKSFVGRIIDEDFIADLPANVDPCGENGEFHSFVFDGPIFKDPIAFQTGEIVYKKYEDEGDPHLNTGFWYIDLLSPLY